MATITWTRGITGQFAIVNGHKVSHLSVGYVVQKLDGGLPTEYVGDVHDSLPNALAATRAVKLVPASSLTAGTQVVEPRFLGSTRTDQVFTVDAVQHSRFTHYRLAETGETRTLDPSTNIEVPA